MRLAVGACALGFLGLTLARVGVAASAPQLADVARTADAAFFAGDAAPLVALAKSTAAWSRSTDPGELYASAYLQFRLAQLATLRRNDDELERAGEACVAQTDSATRRDARSAEAFALQAACYGYLASLGGFKAISNGRKSGKSMTAATAIAPRNPRVLLVDALSLQFRPRIAGGDKAKAYTGFRAAAAAFDAAPTAAAGQPAWGHAEAWYWVGRGAEAAGDAATAMRAYERAVAIVPEFNSAQRRRNALAVAPSGGTSPGPLP